MYRGVLPYCTGCGALRVPLSSPSVNLAGQPSKVGGTVASVAGWGILAAGLSVAVGVGLLLGLLFSVTAAFAVASPIAIVVLVVGILLLVSGRSLRRSGTDAQRATREQALLALIEHQGAATAVDGARVLGIPVAEADALMTDMAKRLSDRVTVDVDDQGFVWFRAPGFDVARVRVGDGVRVEAPDSHAATVRERLVDADADEGLSDASRKARS